jgi:hypothetical protein
MSTITKFNNLKDIASYFRKDLTGDNRKMKDLVLLFAHNGTGKTRLSMEFKELGKVGNDRDTLYFNAFTEDLFSWNNDLDNDKERLLKFNKNSRFFTGLNELDMENKVRPLLNNYSNFNFKINYEDATIKFSREEIVDGTKQNIEHIKVSRGEENIFIWCFFIAIAQLAIDKQEAYNWVKYIYIDDPVSSLDENNAIAVACDLANLLIREDNEIKTIISTHHSLFFNVLYNEFGRKVKNKRYFLHFKEPNEYSLQDTGDTPFFHHIATISELKQIVESNKIYTYHFNVLRSILEKTTSFFGYDKIDKCIQGLEDETLFERALQLFSHGKYSIFDPVEMGDDNKDLFKKILNGFLSKYEFYFPEIFNEQGVTAIGEPVKEAIEETTEEISKKARVKI